MSNEHIKQTENTPRNEINDLIQTLEAHKSEWVQLENRERIQLLDNVRRELWEVREALVQLELSAKGITADSFGVSEEWVILAEAFRAIRQIQSSLVDIESQGRPTIPGPIEPGPDERSVFSVFPKTLWDRLIFRGITGNVWTIPRIQPEDVLNSQAARYRDPDYHGEVALVLAGGNAAMLPFCDSFHKLFVDLQVVVLKMNPVNAHIGQVVERCFQSLIQRGFLAVVYGGADVGEYLSSHPLVEEIHMTGSDRTFEAIVFGSGSEGVSRKLARKPLNNKPFSGELGNVTPVIVVPGPWKKNDIDEYATQIATWIVANAGFTCHTPRVIIQHKSWSQRIDLTETIRLELDQYPTRKAYYPGSFEIHREYLGAHPDALKLGIESGDHLPWIIMPNVDPTNSDDICFRREAFGGLCAETSLDAGTIEEYIDLAVEFANNQLWGTLCVALIVHPKTLEKPAVAKAIERAIVNLRYGTVSFNALPFYSAYTMVCPWGGIPGHDIYDIQSGNGKAFNFLMLDHVEKVILRAPFKRMDPLTIGSKRAHVFARQLAEFEASPSVFKLGKLMFAALIC